jgi:copper chaperone
MSLQLQVPSIVCEACATAVTKAIMKLDPDATVEVDVNTKAVKAETDASEAAVREAIAAIGHQVA